jgi:hypothetical protein
MHVLPMPQTGQLLLLSAPRAFLRQALPLLIAHLALKPLRILDGGNCFNAYGVARELRRRTERVQECLEHTHIARAFTCYQVLTLLAQTPADPTPTLGLDILSTFTDENVADWERKRLLVESVTHLQRLSLNAPVAAIVFNDQPGIQPWLPLLEEAAGQIWKLENPPVPTPLKLF